MVWRCISKCQHLVAILQDHEGFKHNVFWMGSLGCIPICFSETSSTPCWYRIDRISISNVWGIVMKNESGSKGNYMIQEAQEMWDVEMVAKLSLPFQICMGKNLHKYVYRSIQNAKSYLICKIEINYPARLLFGMCCLAQADTVSIFVTIVHRRCCPTTSVAVWTSILAFGFNERLMWNWSSRTTAREWTV